MNAKANKTQTILQHCTQWSDDMMYLIFFLCVTNNNMLYVCESARKCQCWQPMIFKCHFLGLQKL
jgi:hypothetical protein